LGWAVLSFVATELAFLATEARKYVLPASPQDLGHFANEVSWFDLGLMLSWMNMIT
jgi:hypothetical protein